MLSIIAMVRPLHPVALSAEAAEGGVPWYVWLLIALALAAFALFVYWWCTRGSDEGVPEAAAHAPEEVRAGVWPTQEPGESAAAAVPSVPDDLKIVEGIGPKIAGVLHAAGIHTFAQLAGSDPADIRQILERADPRLVKLTDPASWPEQARLAAEGKAEELAALQDSLKGGRRA